jgi:hypothetical protein
MPTAHENKQKCKKMQVHVVRMTLCVEAVAGVAMTLRLDTGNADQ